MPQYSTHSFEPDFSHAVRASFLGRGRVRIGNIDIAPRLSTGGLLLLSALLVEPGAAIGRQELSYALWPDAGRSDAKAALRRHIYNLQRALPETSRPWLHVDTRSIAWNAQADTFVDVAEFNRLRRCGRSSDALDIYTGEFLPAVDHEWALGVREELQRAAVDLAVQEFTASRRSDDDGARYRGATRLLAVDPWREDAVRELMRERAANDDRAGAISYYHCFCRKLRDEIGVEPTAETVACYEDVAAGRVATRHPWPVAAMIAAGI